VEVAQAQLGWNDERSDHELSDYRAYLERFAVGESLTQRFF